MLDHILRASLERNLVIAIIYCKGAEITKRNIKVLRLEGNKVTAYCYLREGRRVFLKENIMAAELPGRYEKGTPESPRIAG